ncbi:endoplasmic reticulum-based factor for assembly of V-ATPase-domain-containing protein [Plectosphaerella plurivora]|uniref:Endoplasmic reticulum-based factor for assembly of V-ATPase-domain-containing protein n=1 Tax=Plectosphaerella plurivora TaxID=936078 RepID=A0A9P8VEM1_9PEZI|nr:endoplasmic reticulum-based factor for assembly of V-ATPase-domain-containing protein [Plectosphaerella plurivora]
MVRLTVTPTAVEALKLVPADPSSDASADSSEGVAEPSLENVKVGDPITHGQVVDLWKRLKASGKTEYTLESLLKGSHVYIPPPPPKVEPSDEYKALMARLRRDEEERSYQRMVKQPSRMETFSQQYPGALSTVHAFAEVNRPMHKSDEGDDDVTYEDVHRQMMLLLNFLVSIFGVAATLWIAARWWNTTARLFLTLAGSILVAIAEVAVYNGYIWRMGEAKIKQDKMKEVKEVIGTWTVGAADEQKTDAQSEEDALLVDTKPDAKTSETDEGVRRRQIAPPT